VRAIHYAGEDLLTGTLIADAVLEYAQALAETEGSATVEIPVIGTGGQAVASTFLLGPSSQLIAVELPEFEGEELTDPELVSRLEELTAQLKRPVGRALPSESIMDSQILDEIT